MTANLSEWFRSTFGGIITMFIDGPNAGKQNIFREDPRFKEILSILSDYSSLRAENELLRKDFEYKNEQLGSALIRVEKAEAELERLKEDCDRTADVVVEQMAQLAKQAPLIQAVMGVDEIDFIADDWPSEKLRESADKLRSEK